MTNEQKYKIIITTQGTNAAHVIDTISNIVSGDELDCVYVIDIRISFENKPRSNDECKNAMKNFITRTIAKVEVNFEKEKEKKHAIFGMEEFIKNFIINKMIEVGVLPESFCVLVEAE